MQHSVKINLIPVFNSGAVEHGFCHCDPHWTWQLIIPVQLGVHIYSMGINKGEEEGKYQIENWQPAIVLRPSESDTLIYTQCLPTANVMKVNIRGKCG